MIILVIFFDSIVRCDRAVHSAGESNFAILLRERNVYVKGAPPGCVLAERFSKCLVK